MATREAARFGQDAYLAQYDFAPRSEPPRVRYMLATTPRSGSTYFAIRLWQTGALGAPFEYLNSKHIQALVDLFSGGDLKRYWEDVQRRRTSANGVFGFKQFINTFTFLQEQLPELLEDIAYDRVIYLTRNDKAAQAVSYVRALQTGVWFAGRVEARKPRYDFDAIENAEHFLRLQEESWEARFAGTGITPLRVTYDELQRDFDGVLEGVFQFLGVAPDEGGGVELPMIDKQSDALSTEWIERYLEEKSRARRELLGS